VASFSKRTDGSWGGVLTRQPTDVSVPDTTVRGVNVVLSREEFTAGKVVIAGQFWGKMDRFEFEENVARIRAPVQSLDFQTRWSIDKGVVDGPMKSLQRYGEAAAPSAPWLPWWACPIDRPKPGASWGGHASGSHKPGWPGHAHFRLTWGGRSLLGSAPLFTPREDENRHADPRRRSQPHSPRANPGLRQAGDGVRDGHGAVRR
jgi:hypothetical protein